MGKKYMYVGRLLECSNVEQSLTIFIFLNPKGSVGVIILKIPDDVSTCSWEAVTQKL